MTTFFPSATIYKKEHLKLRHGQAVNGKVVEIEKDEDDGLIKYDVELKTDRGEADVEIDASTGKVLEVELDD